MGKPNEIKAMDAVLDLTLRELLENLDKKTEFAMVVIPGQEPIAIAITKNRAATDLVYVLDAHGMVDADQLMRTFSRAEAEFRKKVSA